MSERATTRAQVKRRYTHLTWVVSGSLFAAGLGLSLSLVFLGAGILLMAVSVLTALVGIGAATFVPRLMTFVPHPCPFCEGENQVLVSAGGYWCDSCGAYVRTALDYGTVEVRD
jgi:hypothetical protein